ncbi:hypothetical protein RhiJN_09636 [Ceratobasidium sp. AG-Ba]|nr:hypothetical protein RhiJN_09636 [Ceratobasidium sp. AG-Ba]QRW10394.1 hypothetical protein RhiLY_09393 [Ceratobasidium sp. AG-Ba]
MAAPKSGSGKSLDGLLGVEYNGRKTLIERDLSYEATISCIKDTFEGFKELLPEHILLSAYLKEREESVILNPRIWGKLLPQIDDIDVYVLDYSFIFDKSPGYITTRSARVPSPPVSNDPPSVIRKRKIEPPASTSRTPQKSPRNPQLTRPSIATSSKTRPAASNRSHAPVWSISDSEDDGNTTSESEEFQAFKSFVGQSGDSPVRVEIEMHDSREELGRKRKREQGDDTGLDMKALKRPIRGYIGKKPESSKSKMSQSRATTPAPAENESRPARGWKRAARGQMRLYKRADGIEAIKPGRWSYAKHSASSEPTSGRNVGDVHLAPLMSGRPGYHYWVLEDDEEPHWVQYKRGDEHPLSSLYVLRPCIEHRPPAWVTKTYFYSGNWANRVNLTW